MRRWKNDGFDVTLKKAFTYCKSCNKFFKKGTSRQVLCGNVNCLLAHNRLMSKQNGYQRGRVKKQSEFSVIKKKAKRRVSINRAVNSHKPYTAKDIIRIRFSSKNCFDLALELGRSVSSIECARSRYIKRISVD